MWSSLFADFDIYFLSEKRFFGLKTMSLSLLSVSLVYQFAAGVANSTIEKHKVGVEWLNTKKMKKLLILLVCGTLLLTSAESQVSML
jgi:hypothetical protein